MPCTDSIQKIELKCLKIQDKMMRKSNLLLELQKERKEWEYKPLLKEIKDVFQAKGK